MRFLRPSVFIAARGELIVAQLHFLFFKCGVGDAGILKAYEGERYTFRHVPYISAFFKNNLQSKKGQLTLHLQRWPDKGTHNLIANALANFIVWFQGTWKQPLDEASIVGYLSIDCDRYFRSRRD